MNLEKWLLSVWNGHGLDNVSVIMI